MGRSTICNVFAQLLLAARLLWHEKRADKSDLLSQGNSPLFEAATAAATALSTSACVAAGIRPISASVAGFITGRLCPFTGATHSPAIKS